MKDDEVENEKVFVCLSTVAKEEREKDGEFSDLGGNGHLVLASNDLVNHFGGRLSAHAFAIATVELERVFVMVFEEVQDTVHGGKKTSAPGVMDSMALTHYLSNGLVKCDFFSGPPRQMMDGILGAKCYCEMSSYSGCTWSWSFFTPMAPATTW